MLLSDYSGFVGFYRSPQHLDLLAGGKKLPIAKLTASFIYLAFALKMVRDLKAPSERGRELSCSCIFIVGTLPAFIFMRQIASVKGLAHRFR